MRPLSVVTLLFILAPQSALAEPDALQRCRALAADAERLACYDAIVLPAAVAARPTAAGGAAGAVGGPGTAGTPPTASPAGAAAPPAARFGLPDESRPVDRIDRIESRIEGRFEGWAPRMMLRLANGQVWQVVDDTRSAYWLDSPRVVVRRGALGGFLLEIEGVRALVRVRRIE
jgi:hypothetical protein